MLTEERITKKVKNLIEKDPMPVNPMRIALRENINVFHADFEFRNIFAIAKKNKRGVYFYLTANHDQRTQRFILAHLLGHYYLHFSQCKSGQLYCPNRYSSDVLPKKESEADWFAYQLLMPDPMVREFILQNYSVEQMADVFQVSLQRVNVRLNQMAKENSETL
ncbi:ImmA/IrrE family metallo-endopeptidase [Sporolactobacillus pectinivorans]|uniref:ImmA/IrrE family metallo-endopeptidase n=1 Tax=Sporolactobacillus pectinivorans TaxID=1591408 RepID=UPI000C25C498|nr:ImmA/IrrE family metallo-endopeptidase [Sporolactobacillus pectinivorans]